jgi:hypothetical protein
MLYLFSNEQVKSSILFKVMQTRRKNNLTFKPFILVSYLLVLLFACSSIHQYDKYKGYFKLSTEPSGFFRIEQFDGRHYLVTPEGNVFRALGINHFPMLKTTAYDSIVENLISMGFNSGCYQGPNWMWNRFPYSQGINLVETCSFFSEEKFAFEDVFDTIYMARIESKIKRIVSPQAENDYLIGYFLTDIPVWYQKKYGIGWIDFFKALPENSPGGNIWKNWCFSNPLASEEEFIPIIARQIYSHGTALIRKYDNNHLIFSDRYHEQGFPDLVVREVLPFVDGIAIQPSKHLNLNFFDTVYNKYQKPIFIADHVSSFKTPSHPLTMEQVADNQEDYFTYYSSYIYEILSLPYIIGINKCQYMDEIRGDVLKQGLVRQDGIPYSYVSRLSKVYQRALDNAYKFKHKNERESAKMYSLDGN